jgi:hypothetical protein
MARRSATPEVAVMRACQQYLALRGVYFWRSNNVPVYDARRGGWRAFAGLKGVADLLGVLAEGQAPGYPAGTLLAVECKAAGGRLSPGQREFLREVGSRGGLALVARSLDDLRRAIP